MKNSNHQGPVLIHVRTEKGKGYKPAEDSGDKYHGVSKFNVSTGEQTKSKSNTDIANYKKDFFDTQKQLEIKFSETQKEVLGLLKDKYKTLKSMIWEEISNLKQLDNKTL